MCSIISEEDVTIQQVLGGSVQGTELGRYFTPFWYVHYSTTLQRQEVY